MLLFGAVRFLCCPSVPLPSNWLVSAPRFIVFGRKQFLDGVISSTHLIQVTSRELSRVTYKLSGTVDLVDQGCLDSVFHALTAYKEGTIYS